MSIELVHPLDAETLDFFASKGTRRGRFAPQAGIANGVKVRRVMQLTGDIAKVPFKQLRILDLACGEGVYAIEAAFRGAEIVAVDGRTERMNEGAKAAKRLGLNNVTFEKADVRNVNLASHGRFDVIFFLGILYHLDGLDVFPVLRNIYKMCRQFVIIDTHIALVGSQKVQHNGHAYEGVRMREHADEDTESVRKGRLRASLDNPYSFWFTKESLYRLLKDIGFTSVYQCDVPFEPGKPDNRISIIAVKGSPVVLSTYPWVNDKTEDEIEAFLVPQVDRKAEERSFSFKRLVKNLMNGLLSPLGFEIRRI